MENVLVKKKIGYVKQQINLQFMYDKSKNHYLISTYPLFCIQKISIIYITLYSKNNFITPLPDFVFWGGFT